MRMRCLLLFAGLFASAILTHAQALPTATRAGIAQAGLTITSASPDYSEKRISGISAYGTFDFTQHLGAEVVFHDTDLFTPDDIGETSFEVGMRYVYRHGRYEPYARGMVGRASLIFDAVPEANKQRSATGYYIYSLGGGLDIRMGHHINIRAIDFEFQTWPTFSPNNLTPMLISVGAAYRLR